MMMSQTTNGPTAQDVDAAVRSVLADLSFAARVNGVRARGLNRARNNEVFVGRLLSLREAEGLPAGLREIQVAHGTVVTPLARDFLKRLGIGIAFVSRTEDGSVGRWGFAIETVSGVMDAFRRSLLDAAGEWLDLGSSANDAMQWVADAKMRGALVLTDEPSTTVYRACQIAGLRAASAEDPSTTARAVRALGVNLLVVEPLGKPIAHLRQISATFRRGGAPVPPDWIEPAKEGRAS